MMTENLICKPDIEPARELDSQRLKAVIDARIRIGNGAGSDDGEMPSNKTICIMEATAYILGYDRIDDAPPCTSKAIRGFLIGINDGLESDRKRAQLKNVIADIVNTAPTFIKQSNRAKLNPKYRLATLITDPDYKEAEKERLSMIKKFEENNLTTDTWGYTDFDFNRISMPKIIEFVRQLAAVAKFDKANEAVEAS